MAPKDIMTNSHAKSILNAMNSLRKSNTLCDVTLRVEQKDFPAHRIVLAACSDYFCAMFTSEVGKMHIKHILGIYFFKNTYYIFIFIYVYIYIYNYLSHAFLKLNVAQ